jgi:hypothetical protein
MDGDPIAMYPVRPTALPLTLVFLKNIFVRRDESFRREALAKRLAVFRDPDS